MSGFTALSKALLRQNFQQLTQMIEVMARESDAKME